MRPRQHGLVLIGAVGLVAASLAGAQSQGPAPVAEQPVQGLKGHYYTHSHGQGPGALVLDEYSLPVPRTAPDAVRIDRQIAFGRGKGFVGGLPAWAPPAVAHSYPGVGVIWKGYIRFPKTGTYYVTTVSVISSAVYLNQSRVAVNGGSGGLIHTEAFTQVDPSGGHPHGVRVNAPSWAYVVPVTIEAPRVVPIEVRYWQLGVGAVAPGIDLYWVTPDSPRDAKTGKPIPELVPPEVLFVEAPGPIAKATTHAANSTISSEYLDLPIDGETYSTVTVRLADKDGRPVAGHRVHVSSAAPGGDGWDVIVQPEAPTDANGVATAKVRHAAGYGHDSQLFATDVTDLVDVAQVAHLRTGATPGLFFPLTFGPYYDSVNFVLNPMPQVGRPTTITVPLTNRQDAPHELRVRVSIRGYNIGMTNWKPVGETDKFVLKPKENRLASVVWTPTQMDSHVCYKIDILGRRLKPQAGASGTAGLAKMLTPVTAMAQQPSVEERQLESRQQNLGSVTRDKTCRCCILTGPESDQPVAAGPGAPEKGTPENVRRRPRGFVFVTPRRGQAVLREGSSPDAQIVGTLPNGARLLYSEVVEKDGKPRWYYVYPPGGREGWLAGEDTSPVRPPLPVPLKPPKLGATKYECGSCQSQTTTNAASCAGGRG